MNIFQQRESIGSMFQKWTTSGGRAMSFYAGTRLEMTRIESLKIVYGGGASEELPVREVFKAGTRSRPIDLAGRGGAFIERIERMQEERKAIADDIADIYREELGLSVKP